MQRTMLKAKIHRAVVTGADLEYEGSITIDENLLELSGTIPYEQVDVYNVTNGKRFTTYAITGERGRGDICVNGAAAHLVSPGDLVIICCYATYEEPEARRHKPKLVFVDDHNRPVARHVEGEVAGPRRIHTVTA